MSRISLEGSFIDPIVKSGGSLEPRFWKRYRDDSFDIVWGENAIEGKLQEFTDYLNKNVLKGRIVFELEPPGTELNFLDVKVRIVDGYLVPEIYSKSTDAHQYLHATSAHPAHWIRNIPYSVGLRIRRNCSDRAPADHYFMDNLKAYKRYLLNVGTLQIALILILSEQPRLREAKHLNQIKSYKNGMKRECIISIRATIQNSLISGNALKSMRKY